jgi:hypothetical protein
LDTKIAVAKILEDFGGGWTVLEDPLQVPGPAMKSKQTKLRVFLHLVAWVRGRQRIPHGKVFVSLLALIYSKE